MNTSSHSSRKNQSNNSVGHSVVLLPSPQATALNVSEGVAINEDLLVKVPPLPKKQQLVVSKTTTIIRPLRAHSDYVKGHCVDLKTFERLVNELDSYPPSPLKQPDGEPEVKRTPVGKGGNREVPKDGPTDQFISAERLTPQFKEVSQAAKGAKADYIASLTALKHQIEDELEKLKCPVPPLPEPDLSGLSYELFVPRTNPIEHLEKVWGLWLKRFNSKLDRDYLFQDQLGKRDRTLLIALRDKLKYMKKKGMSAETASDYISPIAARNNAKLAESDPHTIQEATRLAAAVANRKYTQP